MGGPEPKDSLPKTCQQALHAPGELPGILAEPVWFLSRCQPQMAVWQEMAPKLCFLSEAQPLVLLCWTALFSLSFSFKKQEVQIKQETSISHP